MDRSIKVLLIIALSALSVETAVRLPLCARESISVQNTQSASAILSRLRKAVKDFENVDRFDPLVEILEQRTFGSEKLSLADRAEVESLLERSLIKTKTLSRDEISRKCQAMIARYFKTRKKYDRAIAIYTDLIWTMDLRALNPLTYLSYIGPDNGDVRFSCKLALAYLSLAKKDVFKAEKYNQELGGNLDGKNSQEREVAVAALGRPEWQIWMGALAAQLAQAYESIGNSKMAAKRYSDMEAFLAPCLSKAEPDPRSSFFLTFSYTTWTSLPKTQIADDFDPLVGQFPELIELIKSYLQFAAKHPELVPRETLNILTDRFDYLRLLKIAQSRNDFYINWDNAESVAIDKLEQNPTLGVRLFKKIENERYELDPNDPLLPSALSKYAYQLGLAGLYSEASRYAHLAIGLREKQGAAGAAGLGQSLSVLGGIELAQGRITTARELFDRAVKLRSMDQTDHAAVAKTEIYLAKLLAESGDRIAAIDLLKKVIGLVRYDQLSPAHRGAPLFRPDQVLGSYNGAATMEAEYSRKLYRSLAIVDLAQLYFEQKQFSLALSMLKEVLSITHEVSEFSLIPRAKALRARIEMASGKLDLANKDLAEAEVAINQNEARGQAVVDIWTALGDLRLKQSRKTDARRYYKKAAERLARMLGPNNPKVVKLRAMSV